jgi:hypothetical protein
VSVEDDLMTSFSYESEQVCGPIGARVSARFNSNIAIDYGELVVIPETDRAADEGSTVYLNNALAYVEGELASNVGWQQLSGPPVILDDLPNARTTFVAPAIDGDDIVELRLAVTSAANQTLSSDVRFDIRENGVMGLPPGLITTFTAVGTYGATGDPIAIESDDIVVLATRSPDVDPGDFEPDIAPYGALDMEFDTDPGGTVTVTIHFPEAVDAGAIFLSEMPFFGWGEFFGTATLAPDLRSVTLEVQDDGPGDMDNVLDGRVLISGGIGWDTATSPPPPPPPPGPAPQPRKGGGGGSSDAWLLIAIAACAAFRRRRQANEL